eukprot:9477913-Pyramimonas_sp.AAC.1
MQLPEELWQRVLYPLPARTLLRARAVCRQSVWYWVCATPADDGTSSWTTACNEPHWLYTGAQWAPSGAWTKDHGGAEHIAAPSHPMAVSWLLGVSITQCACGPLATGPFCVHSPDTQLCGRAPSHQTEGPSS